MEGAPAPEQRSAKGLLRGVELWFGVLLHLVMNFAPPLQLKNEQLVRA